MSELENQQADALQISSELARCLIALNVDWSNHTELRKLAREALSYKSEQIGQHLQATDFEAHARLKFYGLVALMFQTMEEGAQEGEHIHGTELWKAVARALWAEKEAAAK
ncbi:hypothetical protein [Uliginosibacterium sp. TH139]|uniref:hypothetical protein n=1 Tax=Uliginosibacterium sp. TH139 TaxID=2067453 RepID=UPI000C7D193B|nr:hypothetical protein [Uliginosibacterium sp. TH139]PLK50450.1 hypothetical protein C0V76_01075 [Uliginosibacterium sp. TH139]